MCGIYSHMCASSTNGCAFVYFTIWYCIEYSSIVLYFRPLAIHIRHAWNCNSPSISYCWWSSISTIPHRPPPVSKSSRLFTWCQPLNASCGTVPQHFSRHCAVRLKMFYFLCPFFIYCLCEKYYKPITGQCYIANCVSWVPRLTLVNRQLNLRMCSQNRTHSYVGDFWRKSQLCIFVPLKTHDYTLRRGFSGGSVGKESAYNAGELGSIPGSERSPGEGNGNPLQYACLENSMDRGAWWATVHEVTKSQTWLID